MLDFGIDYISSAGLRILMVAAKELRAAGGQDRGANLKPVVAEIFAISRFDRVLGVFPVDTRRDRVLARRARHLPRRRPVAMKRVRFWGTRGSLPVALTAGDVRKKIVTALRAASGRTFASTTDLSARRRPPVRRRRHLRRPQPCVEIETGGDEYFVCDMGSGLRPFGQAARRAAPARAQTFHVFMSHLHWDHIMGFPFFAPAYIPGNRDPHLRLPRRARAGVPPPAGASRRSRSISRSCRREDRVRAARARPHLRDRRHRGDAEAAACTAAIPTATASSATARRSSTRPIPSTSSRTAPRRRALRRLLPRRRPGDLRRDVFARRRHLGEGGLGPLEQHRRRRALPAGRRASTSCLFHHEPAYDDATHRARAGARRGASRRSRAATHALRSRAAYDGMEIDAVTSARAARRRRPAGRDRSGSSAVAARVAGAAPRRRCAGLVRPGAAARRWFDTYQRFAPRAGHARRHRRRDRREEPAPPSASGRGRAPAGRAGRRASTARKPAAIGLDILFPEPDALSPERLLADADGARTARSPPRCEACPPTTRSSPTRSPRRRAVLGVAGDERRDVDAAASAADHRPAKGPRPIAVEMPRRAARRRADQHRRLISAGERLGSELGRRRARHRAAHAARRQRRRARWSPRWRSRCSAPRRRAAHPARAAGAIAAVRRSARLACPTEKRRRGAHLLLAAHRAERFVSATDVLEGTSTRRCSRGKIVLVGPPASAARLPEHAARRAHARQSRSMRSSSRTSSTARCSSRPAMDALRRGVLVLLLALRCSSSHAPPWHAAHARRSRCSSLLVRAPALALRCSLRPPAVRPADARARTLAVSSA